MRRRARFLRKARELAYRDLGGLVFNLHHFGQRNDSLVLAKLSTLARIDAELRALESSLSERQPVTVLREAGITACPRCAAIHSGEDRFCPNCGLSMSRNVDLPADLRSVAGGPAAGPPAPPAPGAPATSAAPAAGAPATPAPSAPAPATERAPAHAVPAPGTAHPQAPPSTQTFVSVRPGSAGRSPAPPAPHEPASSPPDSGEDDQPTEIIRPPATGS
jgi:hypothetical protein